MRHSSALLPCGTRLHLQHGPIDLIIGAEGNRDIAFAAAERRFETLLQELVNELETLRLPISEITKPPKGTVATRMVAASRAHAPLFVTPMAAVAGSVADEVLQTMRSATPLRRAYVNNGGDVAIHLASSERFIAAMGSENGTELGRISLSGSDRIGGIATSGRGGRSLSLGIADSVTVLAANAAEADVAATLIANEVDLPGHHNITREPAIDVKPDSDLQDRLVVTGCGPLNKAEVFSALQNGLQRAERMQAKGLISAAALFLNGQSCQTRGTARLFNSVQRSLAHA